MYIKTVDEDVLSWIIIDRENKANSLNYDTLKELKEAICKQCERNDISAIAIIGAGEKFFSGGTDLNDVLDATSDINKAWKLMYEGLGGVIRGALNCKLPVIAAINGYALGAGFELIHTSDIAYAVKTAKIGLPAVKWGMIPPYSSTLGHLFVNSKLLSYLALTGDMITAEEAFKYGLINGVVDDINSLKAKVIEVARKISSNDKIAVRQIKQLMARKKVDDLLDLGFSVMSSIIPREEVKKKVEEFVKK
ncbi:enoyl-CoA hydratase/isomerase family protein [Caldisphaera lagunensis]|nr:enoyl-CoA hydratase/isomerase family protein [Caldisphaera lagunensis]